MTLLCRRFIVLWLICLSCIGRRTWEWYLNSILLLQYLNFGWLISHYSNKHNKTNITILIIVKPRMMMKREQFFVIFPQLNSSAYRNLGFFIFLFFYFFIFLERQFKLRIWSRNWWPIPTSKWRRRKDGA